MPGDIWELSKRYDNSHETPNAFNSQSTTQGILISFAIISWTCVVLRIHTRYRLQCLGWDDLFVIFFRISGTVGTIFLLLLFNHGFGKHFWEIDRADQIGFQQKYYVALLSYTISTTLMKLCLLSQYLRLFCDDPRARRVCWFFIVVSALWGTAFSIIAIVPCVPVSGFWYWDEPARCYGFGSKKPHEIGGTYAAHVGTNVILDLIVLAIPIPLYFQTFKQKKQRVGFSIMILLGIGINIISIWRLHVIIETHAATYPVVDPTFYGPQSIVLAALEVDLASIVASVPVFWPLLTHSWGAIFVTQEVHVTHHHRRLSGRGGERGFELHTGCARGITAAVTEGEGGGRGRGAHSRSRSDSNGSLKLIIMDTEGNSRTTPRSSRPASIDPSISPSPTPTPTPTPYATATAAAERLAQSYDRNDPYVRGRVYPLEGGLAASEAQVVSEGQRGFERNYREHFGIAAPSLDKLDESGLGLGADRRASRDDHNSTERSWSLSISRKSSQRF
ncbi:putative integral membrane protein [Rosellinia necatrix]|uniref:Putative integral membrane protein n=1 Tax=Rosellinia necatrix TaxID=77044 RepID=A0A1S7ULD4_ROSNE|nr:putative integral membrane protein [Rosellinia necatrix]